MIKAVLTSEGAMRLGVPHLAGKTVQVGELLDNLRADNIFYKGDRIGGVLSYTGDDAGLQLQESDPTLASLVSRICRRLMTIGSSW